MTNTKKKFESTNSSNMSYYSKLMAGVEKFLIEMSQLATEKDIYFEHPYQITLAEEWMASGVVLNWMPMCGDGTSSYSAELVFIWNGERENPASCVRAIIHKNQGKEGYERVFVNQAENEFLNSEQAFDIFIKLKEFENDIHESLRKNSSTF